MELDTKLLGQVADAAGVLLIPTALVFTAVEAAVAAYLLHATTLAQVASVGGTLLIINVLWLTAVDWFTRMGHERPLQQQLDHANRQVQQAGQRIAATDSYKQVYEKVKQMVDNGVQADDATAWATVLVTYEAVKKAREADATTNP